MCIRDSTGIEAHLPDDLAAASHELIEPMRETLSKWGLVADPVGVAEGATASERFLGLTGRDPS